jgi:hypothetical protein
VPDAEEQAAHARDDGVDPSGDEATLENDDRTAVGDSETAEQPAAPDTSDPSVVEETEPGEQAEPEDDDVGDVDGVETLLFGAGDWAGSETTDDDGDEFSSDVVTNQPTDPESSGKPPETPDFLQDAFAVDETGEQSETPSADETDEPAEADATTSEAADATAETPPGDDRTETDAEGEPTPEPVSDERDDAVDPNGADGGDEADGADGSADAGRETDSNDSEAGANDDPDADATGS